jgi:hypothetical protein
MSDTDQSPGAQAEDDAARAALGVLLRPLARLAVAQGVPFAAVEDALKRAFVEAAQQALLAAGLPEHRLVSRISTSTGINRREVTRLTQSQPGQVAPVGGSPASEVFMRWVTDPSLRSAHGELKPLKRQGPAPSFEALARSVTQDVHPRSLLEELCRLGMARLDDEGETVSLLREAFVPGGDQRHMLAFLADNVGDHLNGAVSNVLGDARPHFDQAVFADELSSESLDVVRQFVASQWKRLLSEAVPLLEQCIEADRQAARPQDQRVRIGLYSHDDTMRPAPAETDSKNIKGDDES